MTQELDFIAEIGRMVVKYPSDFFNSISIAQACLESGYGQSELAKEANNLFGYKAKRGEWSGETYLKESPEEIKGAIHIKRSNFRKYESWEESVKDHAKMLSRTDWYANYYRKAINAKTPEEQAKALTGTYATDSKYADKLIEIINYYGLNAYDKLNKGEEKEMATLRKPIVQITRVNTFGRNTNKPKFIVIHYVGAAGQAEANADYFYNVNRNASAHYFIDKKETWQVGYDDMGMWHVGDGNKSRIGWANGYVYNGKATNYNSIGIEMCQNPQPGKPIEDWPIDPIVVEQTLLLTKFLMDKYDIPIDNVVRHYDVSGKMCPAPWRHNDWALWKKFKSDLANLGKVSTQPTIEKAKDNVYTVKHGDNLWAIGQAHGITVKQLKDWNSLESNMIYTGMKLFVKEPAKIGDKKPDSTNDKGVDEKVVNVVEDKGEQTKAIELAEDEYLRVKNGKIEIVKISK